MPKDNSGQELKKKKCLQIEHYPSPINSANSIKIIIKIDLDLGAENSPLNTCDI